MSLKRTISDGNYGSTTIGVTMEEYVYPHQSKAEALDDMIQKEAAFIKAKFKELADGESTTTKEL